MYRIMIVMYICCYVCILVYWIDICDVLISRFWVRKSHINLVTPSFPEPHHTMKIYASRCAVRSISREMTE
jgi:hypothetical protein